MGNLFENLKNYLENTPQDILENDWKEIEYLNEIGPDVIEYARYVKKYLIVIEMSYSNAQCKMNRPVLNNSAIEDEGTINPNDKYYLAA